MVCNYKKGQQGIVVVGLALILTFLLIGALVFENYNHRYGNVRLQMNFDSAVRVGVAHGVVSDVQSVITKYLDSKWSASQFAVPSGTNWFTNLDITVSGSPFSSAGVLKGTEEWKAKLTVNKKVLWGILPTSPLRLQHIVSNTFRANFPHDFKKLAIGDAHNCGLTASREVWCWGSNKMAQLGPNAVGVSKSVQPIFVTNNAIDLKAQFSCTCIIKLKFRVLVKLDRYNITNIFNAIVDERRENGFDLFCKK